MMHSGYDAAPVVSAMQQDYFLHVHSNNNAREGEMSTQVETRILVDAKEQRAAFLKQMFSVLFGRKNAEQAHA